jgi:acetyl esterase
MHLAEPDLYCPIFSQTLSAQMSDNKYPQIQDPGIRAFLIAGDNFYPPDAVNYTMAEQRAFYDTYCAHFRKPRPASIAVKDFNVGAVPCRRYTPRSPFAKLLYLHGGGYVLGGLDSHDDICAELAESANVEVTAVEYRLAPEHPFPAAFDDCWAVLNYVGTCIVAGDSAGGNLSAALCLKSRDVSGPKILGQVLIYPGLDGDTTKGSYITQAHAPGLTTADTIFYRTTYAGSPHKYAGPLNETDYSNLPPAFIVAAGIDPLHDDATDYAARLRAAGGQVELRDEPMLIHAYLRARHMSQPAAASFQAIIAAIKGFAA